jgi:serine/threonine protein phosphatase PrpC
MPDKGVSKEMEKALEAFVRDFLARKGALSGIDYGRLRSELHLSVTQLLTDILNACERVQERASPAGVAVSTASSPAPAISAKLQSKKLPPLRIQNATAGAWYKHGLDLSKTPEFADYTIAKISGLEGSGLEYAAESKILSGFPVAEPGRSKELTLRASLLRVDGSLVSENVDIVIFVNPDPRTLWKVVPPDERLPYPKVNRRCDFEVGPPRVLVASIRGRSHENVGSFREDDFAIGHDNSGNWTVLAVSDGAGSARLSRLGSKLATERCVESLLVALPEVEKKIAGLALGDANVTLRDDTVKSKLSSILCEAAGRAAFDAAQALKEAAKREPEPTDERDLAATLMFAALRRCGNGLLVASYWIGDGAAALLNAAQKQFTLLGDADGGQYSGQTRFLQTSEFVGDPWESIRKRFRCNYVSLDTVLILMTDGVSDPKFGTDSALRDGEKWLSFWQNDLCKELNLHTETTDLPGKLEKYLEFWAQGEHDDRTLGLVYWE